MAGIKVVMESLLDFGRWRVLKFREPAKHRHRHASSGVPAIAREGL